MSVAMEDMPRRQRISVEEYHRMGEVGLIAPDARVELIDGEIIDMPPIGNPHQATVDRLSALLHKTLGDRAIVRCAGSVQLGDFSEPQPDLWVIDVNSRRLHLYRRPSEATYLDVSSLEAPGSMSIERLPGVTLDLSWLLGS